MDYASFPEENDPKCEEVTGEESVWEPLMILEIYFKEVVRR